MEEIKAYKLEDGRVFVNKKEANKNEIILNLGKWYNNNNELFGNVLGSEVHFVDLVDWIEKNKEKIKELLEVL